MAVNKRTRRVVLAYPWTDRQGTGHKTGAELELADVEARSLVHAGRARFVTNKGGGVAVADDKKGGR